MLGGFTSGAERIYLHCGATDFRNQITGLVALVTLQFQLDPYTPTHVFLFCNKRRTSIKVLRYDKNGFILATKKLLNGMKFSWPKDVGEVKSISHRQVEWLLEGLAIEQKAVLEEVEVSISDTCF